MIRPLYAALFCLSAAAAEAAAQPASAQMGLKVTPDTVTIGDPFTLVVRVKVKPGFAVEFPQMPDSADGRPSKIALIGTPLLGRPPGDSLEFRATYRLTAWDTGPQSIPLTDIHVTGPQGTGFIPLRAVVFVKSVLPADTSLHVPKPVRERFPVEKINWWPLILLALAAALGELLWAIYKWYWRRRNAPRDPYLVATEEFRRIEALQLAQKGEPERHALLMAEAMRAYLSAKVPSAAISDTPRQLIEHVLGAGFGDDRVRLVLQDAELLKFARASTTADAAGATGESAKAIVDLVEKQLEPAPDQQVKAA